ncbi:MAG: hypothetical protein NWE80_02380 [Candidatus Bathyarchaeota archaeon]|nr:hypothetical protein [Candidatus Bathyarchaeota archaeon]
MCGWSRRGRQECPSYKFTNERDCFHYWIAVFDNGLPYREGYDYPDGCPWMGEPPGADIPPIPILPPLTDKEIVRKAKLRHLKKRKYDLMQTIEDAPKELEIVEEAIKRLESQ